MRVTVLFIHLLIACWTLTLGVNVFAGEGAYKSTIKAKVIKQSDASDDGKLLHYPLNGQAEVTTLKITIPVNADTGWHYHPYPGYAFVLEGFLEIELESGDKKTYKPGDIIYEVVNRVHQGKNIGDEPVELIAIFTGVQGLPVTVKASR